MRRCVGVLLVFVLMCGLVGCDGNTRELNDDRLQKTVAEKLGVPDDQSITCEISEKFFWESANRYYKNVVFYQEGQIVAFAGVDPTDGALLRNIQRYTDIA